MGTPHLKSTHHIIEESESVLTDYAGMPRMAPNHIYSVMQIGR